MVIALAEHLSAWLAGKCMKHTTHLGPCPHVSTGRLSSVDPGRTCHICQWQAQCGQSTSSTHISQRYLFSVSHLTAKTLSKWGQVRGYRTLVSCWKPDKERLLNKSRTYKERSMNQTRSLVNRINLKLMPRLLNWGTIVAFGNKYTLHQETIWHCTDTKKHTTSLIFWDLFLYDLFNF